MSLRLRLALAFVLLSALPLAGLALYSYRSSSAALRRAAEAEADGLARDLAVRVGSAAAEVDQGVRLLARLPAEAWGASSAPPPPQVELALAGLAPTLRFIEGLSFVPEPPAAPAPAVAPILAVEPVPAVAAVPTPAPVPAAAPAAPEPPLPPGTPAEVLAGRAAAVRAAAEVERESARVQRESIRRELEQAHALVRQVLAETRGSAGAAGSAAREHELAAALERKRETMRQLEAAARPATRSGPKPKPEKPAGGAIDGDLSCEVAAGDQVVGKLQAKLKAKELLRSVLAQTDRERGEIPFALDAENNLYVSGEGDADRLAALPAMAALRTGGRPPARRADDDWVVVVRQEPETGYRYGIARPLSAAMADLKAAAARNFSFGMALVGLALVGMVPVSRRLVRDVHRLEEGAARLADGDLAARVPVGSNDELGRLAGTFNRMAEQLSENQDRLLAEERRRKEEEISRRLLAAENERRRRELEEAREFQLSLLPRELPRRPGLDLAVSMTTATEVGGDYYDFLDAADGGLVLAVGDATGHGAAAGTMVTAVKGLFAGRAAEASPAEFLAAANAAVHRMGLVRRAMALTAARIDGRRVTISAAGMPPVLHVRAATGRVEEIALAGTPLGARGEFPYAERVVELEAGDALLFLSDGLPELPNPAGEPYGYERLAQRFATLAADSASGVVAGLEATAADWNGRRSPADDVTFLVLKAT